MISLSTYKGFLLFGFLLLSIPFFAQNKKLEKADEYFNNFNYSEAIEYYQKLLERGEVSYYSTYQIAKCYSKLGNADKAVSWFKKTIEYPDADFEVYDLLAQECKKVQLYDEASQYLKTSYRLKGVRMPESEVLNENYINWLKRDSLLYHISQLSINTKYSDFGPVLYKDQLVFCSNRKINQAIKRSDVRKNTHFYKLYSCKRNGLNSFGKVKYFEKSLRSSFNDGPVSFNSDNTKLFVTSNTSYQGGASFLNIFICDYYDKKWRSKRTPVPLSHKGFSQMHAFLTKDESKLYFVSDIKGGYGGTDIYVSNYKNGFLSPPENLGPLINTSGNESFPYVDEDGVLYFTSDGHPGLGGLDIFYAVSEDGTFSEPINIGYPINTSDDDFNLILIKEEQAGYFCSNRKEAIGEDDIFSFTYDRKFNAIHMVGSVFDKDSNNKVDKVIVELLYDDKVIKKYTTSSNGAFELYIDDYKNYTLRFKHRYYKTQVVDLLSVNPSELQDLKINMIAL